MLSDAVCVRVCVCVCVCVCVTQMLSEGDKDKDGWMSEEEFMSVELWFQYRAFQPGSDSDPEASHLSEEARAEAKKIAFDR